ncbi:DUF2235 domain-containing protein [Isoptericola aurantiacus]|uniref:DUF2235 domain-containing protein n=1 Tax=Isoptericola aurantiacus TaxID=3377839 RepID=UPI00383BA682
MKRLVLCCDGTWNHAVSAQVTNVEKLVRCVVPGRVEGTDDVQVVGYVGGVGAHGYLVDRLLGGAFGYGLTRNVVDGYRFLAANYVPGDEIHVVGYSRGAYTARSVVGMIAQVGLLTPESVDAGLLDDAERTYRLRDAAGRTAAREAKAAFRAAHSYDVRVRFLGVYDTVGALGVPGLTRRRSKFHDVTLSSIVDVARQGLAIDERRITFAPCLWTVPDDDDAPDRVQQVWFPGGHSDVGGGSPRAGLSDVALAWMAHELSACGVVLDEVRLARQMGDDPWVVDTRPSLPFRLINLVRRARPRYGVVDGRRVFRRGLRVLALPADGGGWRDHVALADTAVQHVVRDRYGEQARNLGWWLEAAGGVESVPTVSVGAAPEDAHPLRS